MGIATSFVVIISCLFIACYFDLAVVEQSYFETMRPLLDDGRFGFMLGEERIPLSQVHLQPFALLPLTFVNPRVVNMFDRLCKSRSPPPSLRARTVEESSGIRL